MKKMFKSLILICMILIFSMLLGCSGSNVKDIYNEVGTAGLKYELSEDGKYYSVIEYTGHEANVIVPSVYKGLPVTTIKTQGVVGFTDEVKSITISYGITDICYGAFAMTVGLEKIILPNSVDSIGKWAFYGCKSLKKIVIPKSAKKGYIDHNAFEGCDAKIVYK